ncbi:MAG: hypothetical protein Q8N53_00860 [Longimicrobiales bacterium]|nr:hypothetical protein [Longimicrobiales bacterium]
MKPITHPAAGALVALEVAVLADRKDEGAAVGLVVGTMIGYLALHEDEPPPTCEGNGYGPCLGSLLHWEGGDMSYIGILGGAVLGAGLGLFVGSRMVKEEWMEWVPALPPVTTGEGGRVSVEPRGVTR